MGNKKVNKSVIEKKLQDVMVEFRPVVQTKKLDKIIRKASRQIFKSLPGKTFDRLSKNQEQSFFQASEDTGTSHVSIQDLP